MVETKITLKFENEIVEAELSATLDASGQYEKLPWLASQLAEALYSQIEPALSISNDEERTSSDS